MRLNYIIISALLLLFLSSCKHVKKVPYTTVERVSEELSFTKERGQWNRESGIPGLEYPKLIADCYLTNTSVYDGTFTVHFVFNSQGDEVDFSASEYVRAGERKNFSIKGKINHYTFENNVTCSVNVKPPVIQVDKEVTKYQEEVYYSLF